MAWLGAITLESGRYVLGTDSLWSGPDAHVVGVLNTVASTDVGGGGFWPGLAATYQAAEFFDTKPEFPPRAEPNPDLLY